MWTKVEKSIYFLTSEILIKRHDENCAEYEQNKITEKVSVNKIAKAFGQVHYLPHQPVVREDKQIT